MLHYMQTLNSYYLSSKKMDGVQFGHKSVFPRLTTMLFTKNLDRHWFRSSKGRS